MQKSRPPFRPYGAAAELMFGPRSRDKEIVLVGPAGTGKSRGVLEKLHLVALKYPGCRILIVRKTRVSLTDTILVTYENKVLPAGSYLKKGARRPSRVAYRYRNGSEIVVGGMDRPEKVLSSEYDIVYFGELIEGEEDDWEMLMSRLRDGVLPYRQIIGDTNPGHPAHWLKRRIDAGVVTHLPSLHQDNPAYFDHKMKAWTPAGAEYLDTLSRLTGHRRKRLLLGEWAASEGARFPELDERHRFRLREQFPHGFPDSWRLIVAKDYGKRAPYCALWIAFDHEGGKWVFREDYQAGLHPSDQARRVVAMTKANETIAQIRVDPSVFNASPGIDPDKTEPAIAGFWRAIYEADKRFGPMLRGFNRSRMHALGTIDEHLDLRSGAPKLHIEESCVQLWQELTGAIWDTRGRAEDIDSACPDHAITALYYGIHTHSGAPEVPRSLAPVEDVAQRVFAEDHRRAVRQFQGRTVRRF